MLHCRLVPALGLVILISVFILPYLNDGPLWYYTAQTMEIGPCASNWWTNLLMVANIANPDKVVCTNE